MNKLVENFKGSMPQFKEFFLKKWCREHNLSEDKWTAVGVGLLNDIKVKFISTPATDNRKNYIGKTFTMWAGSSGCNFMMVDKTGGSHNSFGENDIYEVIL